MKFWNCNHFIRGIESSLLMSTRHIIIMQNQPQKLISVWCSWNYIWLVYYNNTYDFALRLIFFLLSHSLVLELRHLMISTWTCIVFSKITLFLDTEVISMMIQDSIKGVFLSFLPAFENEGIFEFLIEFSTNLRFHEIFSKDFF